MRRSSLPLVVAFASLASVAVTAPARAVSNNWTIVLSNCR